MCLPCVYLALACLPFPTLAALAAFPTFPATAPPQ